MSSRRAALVLAILAVLIGSIRIARTWKVFSFTIDEPAHAACGVEWLENGTYTYEDQHPPLARVVGAIGIVAAGNDWGHDTNMWMEGFRLLQGGGYFERGLVFGRAAMLPFFWIASAGVFFWTRRLAGNGAAVCAVALFTSLPPVLAHAGLITTDMALTAFMALATAAMLWWVEEPSAVRTLLFGLVLGLTLLTKFSALPFLPCAWAAMWCVRPRRVPVVPLVLACAVAVCVVLAFYHGDFEGVLRGIASVRKHNAEGHSSYLFGQISMKGFWYYYPAVLAVKTPLALLALIGLACWKWKDARQPLAFAAGILLFAAFSNINIGVRHVLPVYAGLCVAAGIACAWMLQRTRWRVAAFVLMAAHLASGAWQAPDYLAYTNELFMRAPEKAVVDSDLDWGQDMKRLAQRMKELGVTKMYFQPFSLGYKMGGMPFPEIQPPPAGDAPPPGWTAVSKTMWKFGVAPAWVNKTKPTERVGRSILLFHR